MQSWVFSIITSSVSHDPSEIILISCLLLKKHIFLLLVLKTAVLIIILWNNHKCDFRILWWMENSNQQHLFETEFL